MIRIAAVILLEGLWVAALGQDCSTFQQGFVCPLEIDNVVDIDGDFGVQGDARLSPLGAEDCQYSCFRDKRCSYFTFFMKRDVKKCVLFKTCPRMEPCKSCFSGPAQPSIRRCSGEKEQPRTSGREQPRNPEVDQRLPKQLDDEDTDDEFSVEGIDEGLLSGDVDAVELPDESDLEEEEIEEDEEEEAFPDEYFDEEVEEPSRNNVTTTTPFFHCMMGGYGPLGVDNSLAHVVPAKRPPRLLLPNLPAEFPLGRLGMFGTIINGDTVMACSPGAAVTTASPYFGFTTQEVRTGECYAFSPTLLRWQPLGSPMNGFRGGGTITRMGRFIIATGGRSFPSALNSVEVLNTRRPSRWRTLTRLTLPQGTSDHCAVAINRTAMLVTGGFGQESQAIMMDLKAKRWEAMEPMKQPRREHSCTRARINGMDGVIVAGGSSDAVPALASLEFFDLRHGRWLSLGRMRQGRRFPGILVIARNLIVMGGESTDPFGRTLIYDDMETLRKRSWRPVKQRMPQARSRFATVRIPKSLLL